MITVPFNKMQTLTCVPGARLSVWQNLEDPWKGEVAIFPRFLGSSKFHPIDKPVPGTQATQLLNFKLQLCLCFTLLSI